MADNYYGKCAMCQYFNLYDKYSFVSDKYKCTLKDSYRPWSDTACDKYRQANRTPDEVEDARKGKYL